MLTWAAIKLMLGKAWSFIAAHWQAFLFVLICLYAYYENNAYNRVKNEYAEYKVKVENEGKKQQEKNKQELVKREEVTKNVVQSYADSINKVNDYYAKNPTIKYRTFSMCDSSANSGGMSSEAISTKGVDKEADRDNETATESDSGQVQIDMEKLSKEIVQFLELINFELKQDSIK